MRKTITTFLILTLIFCSSTVLCFGANNHGADARSESMSVESGENPIPDKSVTLENGGASSDEETELAEEDAELEDASGALGTLLEGRSKFYLVGGATLFLIVILIVVFATRRKRKASERSYKHLKGK